MNLLPIKILFCLAACVLYLILVAGCFVIFKDTAINVGPIQCADCPGDAK